MHLEASYENLTKMIERLREDLRTLHLQLESMRNEAGIYENLLDMVQTAVTITRGKDGVLRFVNETFCRLTGYRREEVLGKSSLDLNLFCVPDDRKKIADLMLQFKSVENLEINYQAKNGKVIETLISASFIAYRGERCVMLSATPIGTLKKAKKELEQQEQQYRLLVETTNEGIVITKDGYVVSANNKLQQLLGYTEAELLGRHMKDFLHPDDADMIESRQRQRQKGEQPPSIYEFKMVDRQGQIIWAETHSTRVTWQGADAVLSMLTNLTQRKRVEAEKRQLEDRLQQAKKMEALGQLAGGVAHDLNNVLGVLSGYSELLLMEIPDGHPGRRSVERIVQSTEKGAAIIQDLLTLARRGVTALEIVNFNEILDNFQNSPVFEKMQQLHPQVRFSTKKDPHLLNIKGSTVHLEKTLINLMTNAAEAITGDGDVVVCTENRYLDNSFIGYDEVREGDYVVVSVSDSGSGIPAGQLEKIFEPFFTKKVMGRSGTGLGLAIVWGTVKDHNGYIDVQSRMGEGTTFTIYFPATRESLCAPRHKVPMEQVMGTGESVLVVDDIAEQREVALVMLKSLGYEVHTVAGGEEAVEYLKSNRADILVLDMIMNPGIDGLETYRRILEINPRQKAVLVSGFSETSRVREAQRLGAGAYVKKPYLLEKIGLSIKEELSR